jgi:hypothetical protein
MMVKTKSKSQRINAKYNADNKLLIYPLDARAPDGDR